MGITYARFVEAATAAGLLTGEALARAEQQIAESQHAGDAGELARLLVQDGMLTKHQRVGEGDLQG
ncbi:MAG TPA: hypothetical protein VHZ24_12585 [Pirellulales bacterium]|jgi:hypothetical protein|nr:hypothetical protein [Pirellulales bacterium]